MNKTYVQLTRYAGQTKPVVVGFSLVELIELTDYKMVLSENNKLCVYTPARATLVYTAWRRLDMTVSLWVSGFNGEVVSILPYQCGME